MSSSASLFGAALRRHNRQHLSLLQMSAPSYFRGLIPAQTTTTASSSNGPSGEHSLPVGSSHRMSVRSYHPMPLSSLVSAGTTGGISRGAVAVGLRGFVTTAVFSGDGRSCAGMATSWNDNGSAGKSLGTVIGHQLCARDIGTVSAMTTGSRSWSSATVGINGATESRDDDASLVDEIADEDDGGVVKVPGWELLHSPPRGKMIRGSLVGTVVSDKMQKTVNVAVDRYRIVPKYRKRVRYTRKFMAHDEEEVCNVGDLVMIVPDRRRSRHKHFRVHEIIRAKGVL